MRAFVFCGFRSQPRVRPKSRRRIFPLHIGLLSFHYTFKNQETIWYPVKIANALTTLGPLLVIVPFALADLLAKLNIRFFAPRSLRILGMTIHTTPEGVWAALLITVLVVGIAAVFALNKRRTRKLCANFLSKSQMRFGY